jgi:dihydroxyacetone kinase-like protein
MSAGLTSELLAVGIERMGQKMVDCQDELNTLDGKLGDGDLGITMSTGFNELARALESLPEDVGMAFFACAQAFVRTRASSYGTLLATGLMSAAKETRGETVVSWNRIPDLLQGAIVKMGQRGKSQLGDKTVLDALEAARRAMEGMDDPALMLKAADQAVSEAIEVLKEQPSKQGRARMFGDRSLGLYDPGMVVIKRMLESLSVGTTLSPTSRGTAPS